VSEAFETLLMPQASLDLANMRPEPFAVAAHHQGDTRPKISEVKSLSTLNKQSRPVEPPKPKEQDNSGAGVNQEQRPAGQMVRPMSVFGADRNEIGLPLRTFKAVLSEPVDV
jgi:hypothetical protein